MTSSNYPWNKVYRLVAGKRHKNNYSEEAGQFTNSGLT
jgi:hypothetical protein